MQHFAFLVNLLFYRHRLFQAAPTVVNYLISLTF